MEICPIVEEYAAGAHMGATIENMIGRLAKGRSIWFWQRKIEK